MNHSFSQVKFGLKAGVNLSNVQFPEPSDTKTKLSFYGGFLGEIDLGKKFLVQPELLYSIKGFKFDPAGFSSGGHVNINYLSLPLLAGFQPIDKLKILLGPELNFLTAAKSKIDNSGSSDLKDVYKHFDLSANLGVAYQLQERFGVEVRYNYGFSYLAEGATYDPVGNMTGTVKLGKNRTFQAGLFYKL